jgi:hypothetical protein
MWELDLDRITLSSEGKGEVYQNSNFRSIAGERVKMGSPMTLKIIKSYGCKFSRDPSKCHGFLNILPVFEWIVFGIHKGWF